MEKKERERLEKELKKHSTYTFRHTCLEVIIEPVLNNVVIEKINGCKRIMTLHQFLSDVDPLITKLRKKIKEDICEDNLS